MRIPLVAANWKMNGSREFAEQFFSALNLDGASCEVVVCPPFPYLPLVAEKAGEMVALGAQNLSEEVSGAFTGEVSASMLLDWGVRYAIVGHSERRSLYGESSEQVARKFVAAQSAGLTPILCVGESRQEREEGRTLEVIGRQLQTVAEVAGSDGWKCSVIAYEPVWAIGTGVTATPEQAQEVHRFIRGRLGDAGATVRILYGGSVKADNAESLFAQADIDGALVGGASLKAEEFAKICRAAD
ncbi:triose-phosphate isomerase [Microbulbifer thermotolerans]|uniref:triose-phosphate isomerase n=1 Tax=Microbulbifer thermotolerans TaxID=252514 RepID=UPI00224B927A|nr:triose-phosphate isomerase [Microbulbifer thermotolerans]MCX2840671.1 triose-phosphate isomerase [Microbulbifer thermotolerans]